MRRSGAKRRLRRESESGSEGEGEGEREEKRPRRRIAREYFEDVVARCGLSLSRRELDREPLAFCEALKAALEGDADFPRNVDEFARGFEEEPLALVDGPVSLRRAGDDEPRPVRSGALRLLLDCGVGALQRSLVECVAGRALALAVEDDAERALRLLRPLAPLDDPAPEAEDALAARLLELLDAAGPKTRLELVAHLPDLVAPRHHALFAPRLCALIAHDWDSTPAILDCVAHFRLPPAVAAELRDGALDRLLRSAPLRFLPNVVKFALARRDDPDVVRELRDGLDWTVVGTQSDAEVGSSQTLTALELRDALARSKTLRSRWTKIVETTDEHKPIDVIVSLAIYSLKNGKERLVENAFRKKIDIRAIETTVKTFKPVVAEYVDEILEIALSMLRAKSDPSARVSGARLIETLFFEVFEARRTTVDALSTLENETGLASALTVLSKISERDVGALKPFSSQLMALVDRTRALDEGEFNDFANVLCNLAFGVENSPLRDDVHMLIRKQLSGSDPKTKSRGIAGGVAAVKYLTRRDKDGNESERLDCSQTEDLPEGRSKEAAEVVELIFKCADRFSDMICYFYDELANVVSSAEGIDRPFLVWLTNRITDNFQNSFVVDVDENSVKSIDDIVISSQYCLDAAEDVEEPIAINVANLVFGPNPDNVNLKSLPSWFRILQILHKKNNGGDLSSIDALLGCGIVMPDVVSLEEFNPDYYEKIFDCFVYCINWFRESISAFGAQTEPAIKKKVIQRLNGLLILEKRLQTYLEASGANYVPPPCVFTLNSSLRNSTLITKEAKPKPKPKPKQKSKSKNTRREKSDNTALEMSALSETHNDNLQNERKVKNKLNVNLFRKIQFDSVDILSEELHVKVMNDSEEIVDAKVNLDSFIFLLNEIIPQLSIIFPTSSSNRMHHFMKTSERPRCIVNHDFAVDKFVTSIPILFGHMEKIAEYVMKSLDSCDGVRDALSIFTETNIKVQLCLMNIFEIFTLILSWVDFRNVKNKHKLIECFKRIQSSFDPNAKCKNSLKDLLIRFSVYISKYKDWCLTISTAASLVKLFSVIVTFVNDEDVSSSYVNMCYGFLTLQWKDEFGIEEKGLGYNRHVDTLFNGYFSRPDTASLHSLVVRLLDECPKLVNKNSTLEMFPSINKSNFPLLFRALCKALYEAIKNQIDAGLTDRQHLDLWKEVTRIMKYLTDILKVMQNRSNLAAFLKRSIPLFKLFLSHGMPMMDLKLKTQPDDVVEILRMLQHSTRFLHSLYCHSKLKNDTALIAYLPQMKLVLETLVYKVKASLAVNNCSEAFWMGNLKNKNLQGEIILSQSTVADESDDDDQLPEDENSMSDDNGDDDDDMKSVSSII